MVVWIAVGDMLEIWTNGKYKATPHRVRAMSTQNRLSAPLFFDPNFHCIVEPIQGLGESSVAPNASEHRSSPNATEESLESKNVHYSPSQAQAAVNAYRAGDTGIKIRYGDYILNKVLTVFPQLSNDALQDW